MEDLYSRVKLRESSSRQRNSSMIVHSTADTSPEMKKKSIAEIDEQAVARKKDGRGRKKSDNVSYEFEIGDLVWGKITSHPWWPGVVYDPAFASNEAMSVKKEGQLAVFLYGDSSHGWISQSRMLPFEEHFAAKAGKTDNEDNLKGVELALEEVKRRSILGFVCNCHHGSSLRKTRFVERDLYKVDFGGFIDGGVYSGKQMQKAREDLKPENMLSFLQQLAANARNGGPESADRISITRNTSQLRYYRNYVRRQRDEDEQDEYSPAFPEAQAEEQASMDFVWGSGLKLKSRMQNDLNQKDISLGFPTDEPITLTRFVWGNSPFPKGRRQRRRPRKPKAPTPVGNAAEHVSSNELQLAAINGSTSDVQVSAIGSSTNDFQVSVTGGSSESPETGRIRRRDELERREPPRVQSSRSDPERRQRLLDLVKRFDEIIEKIKDLGS